MRLTYNNWRDGRSDSNTLSLNKIEPKDLGKVLEHSLSLIVQSGNREFERMKSVFEKRNIKSIDPLKAKRIALKYYEKMLSVSIKENDKGYLVADGLYSQETQYDVQFIRDVQSAYVKLLRGNLNIIIPDPNKEETINQGKPLAALTAYAWHKFILYLKGTISGKVDKLNLKENSITYDETIFTSLSGFQIFQAFKNDVVRERYEYADYSFLFMKLKKDGFIRDMKEKKFIDYLWDVHQVKFASNYKQFKFSETESKKREYSRLKQLFGKGISGL